jgi:uncharacterized protein YggE
MIREGRSKDWTHWHRKQTVLKGRPFMVILFFIMVWLVVPLPAWAYDEAAENSTMTVTGQGQTSLPPDTAFVTLGTETTGRTVGEAQRHNRLAMNKIIERLRAWQIEHDRIQTASFTVSPQYKPPPKRSEAPSEPPEIIGYVVSNMMTVEVRNLDRVASVIEEALAAGANQFLGLHWALLDEQQAKIGALKRAAIKAREKARALSEALKVKLMRLRNVNEESHVARPVHKMARTMTAVESGGTDTAVFSGEIKIEATVTLVYEIGQE